MNVQITSDNIDISPSMQELAHSKLEKLKGHFADTNKELVSFRVVMNKGEEEDSFNAKIEMNLGKMQFIGDSTGYSLETALISAVEEVERQYVKEKSKRDSDGWEEAREMKRFPVDEVGEIEEVETEEL